MMVTACLIGFVAVVLGDLAALLFDVWLLGTGRATITHRVKDEPILGAPLVVWQVLGAAFLAGHLWGGWGG